MCIMCGFPLSPTKEFFLFLADPKGQHCISSGDRLPDSVRLLSSNFQCYTDISELDEGINPNPFPNDKYGQGQLTT